jgi:hypothetical protein
MDGMKARLVMPRHNSLAWPIQNFLRFRSRFRVRPRFYDGPQRFPRSPGYLLRQPADSQRRRPLAAVVT